METTLGTITTRDLIKKMNDAELELFIRNRLKYDNHQLAELRLENMDERSAQHRRFDMSGSGQDNSCYIHNFNILNLFRDCGIYDKVRYLYLDAYKGHMTLYYRWFNEEEGREIEFGGWRTVGIITEILKTFSIDCKKPNRRMD